MSSLEPPLILPPDGSGDWRRMGEALLDVPRGVPVDSAMHDYAAMADALKAANQPRNSIPRWRIIGRRSCRRSSKALAKARAEIFFNQMQPFYNAMVIYVLAGCSRFFHGSICRKRCAARRSGSSDWHL
jgi:hypothetical protein